MRLDGPQGPNGWGINLEVPDPDYRDRQREFELPGPGENHEERYYLTYGRRLGAQKHYAAAGAPPDLRFSV